MPYGGWSADRTEFIVRRPDTPRPWRNLLGNRKLRSLVSHTGGGTCSAWASGPESVLEPWRSSADRPGRYLWLRDCSTGRFWPLNWQPACSRLDLWEARHGQGYTRLASELGGVRGELLIFAALEDPVELWRCKILNSGSRPVKLTLFSFAALAPDCGLTGKASLVWEGRFERALGAVVVERRPTADRPAGSLRFLAGSRAPSGYDTHLEAILGRQGSLAAPAAIREGKLTGSRGPSSSPAGALQFDLELERGEEAVLHLVMGHAQNSDEMRRLVAHHLEPGAAAAELESARAWLRERTSRVRLTTPSPDLDLMVGSWGAYQVLQSARTSALASGEHLATPAEFLAAADAAEALLPLDPALSRELLLSLLQHQFKNGSVLHPGADTRDLTVPAELGCLDTALRLPLLVCAYVKETGEASLLKERVAYLDDGSATVHQHATAAADFARKHTGQAGLPYHPGSEVSSGLDAGGDDAPDGSVKLAMMLAAAYSELEELSLFLGERAKARRLKERFEELAATIDRTAWSGRWYRRMVSAEGRWLGGEERGGPLFLDVQAWALLSGVAHGERARKMLEAIRQLNGSAFGPCLLSEPFAGWAPSVGSLSSASPGLGPNGSIRGVEALQLAAGALELGESELALGWLQQLSPLSCGQSADQYRAEPFLWPGWIAGAAAGSLAGEAHGAWEGSTAAWALRTVVGWMFGVRPGYAGLVVDPCLPASWETCTLVRPFRGAVYRFEYRNPGRRSRGLAALRVDGKKLQGNVVPPFADGKEHRVEVTMG